MAVSVLLSGTLKDGLVDQFSGICTEAFHVTRAFDGCQNINLTLHVEDPHKFVLTEVWIQKSTMKNIWLLGQKMELLGLLARCVLMGRT